MYITIHINNHRSADRGKQGSDSPTTRGELFLSTTQLTGSGWGFRKITMALENKKGKYLMLLIGLATEFRSEKIPRNRLGMASVIPRKKVLIPRFTEESILRLRIEEMA